jgi:hypothetical protein
MSSCCPQIVSECPICMDDILSGKNMVTTECGHVFHSSCLLNNVAVNGFGCPLCRNELATPSDEDSEDDDDFDQGSMEVDDDDFEPESKDAGGFDDYALESFRMFCQQLEGEDVEEAVAEQKPEIIPICDKLEMRFKEKFSYKDVLEALLFSIVNTRDSSGRLDWANYRVHDFLNNPDIEELLKQL